MSKAAKPVPTSLPDWIPWAAATVHWQIVNAGGFQNERKAKAFSDLYLSQTLSKMWESLQGLGLNLEGWDFLIRAIINNLDCAPPPGKSRATRKDPDEKIKVLERQKEVDRLLKAASDLANDLSDVLAELEANGGELPAKVYSGLSLIEGAMEYDRMASAVCLKPFNEFKGQLSSYQKSYFPKPVTIIDALALAVGEHPATDEIFADDPWLSSSHSSWKDYVRALSEDFEHCYAMHGDAPVFTDSVWADLLRVLIWSGFENKAVAKELRGMSREGFLFSRRKIP